MELYKGDRVKQNTRTQIIKALFLSPPQETEPIQGQLSANAALIFQPETIYSIELNQQTGSS